MGLQLDCNLISACYLDTIGQVVVKKFKFKFGIRLLNDALSYKGRKHKLKNPI